MQDSRVLQYNGISFSCIHNECIREVFSLKEHSLIYLGGGTLDIYGPEGVERLNPGESVFLRKDRSVTLAKSMGEDGTPFKMVVMTFGRPFLVKYYRHIRREGITAVRSGSPLLKIPSRPDVTSLFQSLMPFFWSEEKPDEKWVEQKRIEGIKCILKTDRNVCASLFDFTGEWKIDLAEFMESTFTSDLSLEDYANYTGRSLSTFNRDFRKIYGVSPEKWISVKRLERAHELLLAGTHNVGEAASEAGFTNLSHFSRVYKAKFGVPPSAERLHPGLASAAGQEKMSAKRSPADGPVLIDASLVSAASGASGIGELILDALDKGAVNFIIRIKGIATTDAGVGMLSTLGVRFMDEDGRALEAGGLNLPKIRSIDMSDFDSRLQNATFTVSCDVEDTFPITDEGMKAFANLIRRQFGIDLTSMKGSGAAGGLCGVLAVFLHARLTF